MRVIEDLIVREIAGEHFLIPTGNAALRIHGMLGLSESGYLMWNKLQSECEVEELVEAILAEYDVERETASEDVRSFLEKMERIGILVRD